MPSEQPDHLNIRLQIDAIADQYEKSSAAETDPERRAATIRQLLQYHLSLPQAALLLELLSIELERAVPEPQLRSLFPDHSDVVEQVIQHEKRAAQGFDPGPPTVISAPVAESSEPLPVIPGYELLQCIGRGGMGAVYRAIQHGTRKTVAVKTILAKWSGNDRAVKRFENECLAAARLDNHPHMARVLELGECPDGQRFYAMDYIEGQNLKQRIQLACDEVSRHRSVSGSKRDTPAAATDSTLPAKSADQEQSASEPANRIYPNADFLRTVASEKQSAGGHRAFEQAVRIGIDAADALAYAHEAGIVHRDIKPANLLLDQKTGHVVVADFGLAQITEHQLTQAITNPGEVMGTYGYMSPEQLLGNRVVVDSLTDVFSLGATLYELLTLQPIRRGTDAEIMRAIAFEDPVRMRKLVPAIPEDLETIIHAAIASRPQDRYQSMARFRDDLQRWLDRKPIQARPPGLLKRASLWVERNQKLSAVISSAVLVILFILGVAWRIQAQQTLVQSRLKDEQQELKEEAIAQSKENKSLYLVASSHLERDNDPTLATLLAIEAQKLHKSPEATAALVMAMRENHEVRSWNVRDGSVREGAMAVHPNNTRLVTTASYLELHPGHPDLPAIESDILTGTVEKHYDGRGVAIEAAWSPDGHHLLICSATHTEEDSDEIRLTWHLWEHATGKQLPRPLAMISTSLTTLKARSGKWPFGFSQDSTQIAIADESSVHRYRVHDGSAVPPTNLVNFTATPLALTWTQSGNLAVVTADQRVHVINPSKQTTISADAARLSELDTVELHSISKTALLLNNISGPSVFAEQTLTDITPNYWARLRSGIPNHSNIFTVYTIGDTPHVVDGHTLKTIAAIDTEGLASTCRISPNLTQLAVTDAFDKKLIRVQRFANNRTRDSRPVTHLRSSTNIVSIQWISDDNLISLSQYGRLGIWTGVSGDNRRFDPTSGEYDIEGRTTASTDSKAIAVTSVSKSLVSAIQVPGLRVAGAVEGRLLNTVIIGDRVTTSDTALHEAGLQSDELRESKTVHSEYDWSDVQTDVSGTTVLRDSHGVLYEWYGQNSQPFPVYPLATSIVQPSWNLKKKNYSYVSETGDIVIRSPYENESQVLPINSTHNPTALSFSPDGDFLALVFDDSRIAVHSPSVTDTLIAALPIYDYDDVQFSHDSSLILVQATYGKTGITIVAPSDGAIVRSLDIPQLSRAVFSPATQEILYGTTAGLFRLPLVDSAEPIAVHHRPVIDLDVAHGSLITIERSESKPNVAFNISLNGSQPSAAFIYDLHQLNAAPARIDGIIGQPRRVRISQLGECAFIESQYWTAEVSSSSSAEDLANGGTPTLVLNSSPLRFDAPIVFADFLPHSNRFAAIDSNGEMQTWNISTNELLTASITNSQITNVAMASASGDIFVCMSSNDLFRYRRGDPAEGTQLNTNRINVPLLRLHPAPNGQTLVALTGDGVGYISAIQREGDGNDRITALAPIAESITSVVWASDASRVLLLGRASSTASQITVYDCDQEATRTFSFDQLQLLRADFRNADSLVLLTSTGQIQLFSLATQSKSSNDQSDFPDILPVSHFQVLPNDQLAVQQVNGDRLLIDLKTAAVEVVIPDQIGKTTFNRMVHEMQKLITPDGRWFLPTHNLEFWPTDPFSSEMKLRPLTPTERRRFRVPNPH